QAMIGERARNRDRRLDRVDAIHCRRAVLQRATSDDVAGITHAAWRELQQVGIERDDDAGLLEVVVRLDILAKGGLRTHARSIASRLVGDPASLGQRLEQSLHLAAKGRRSARLGQDAQASAAIAAQRGERAIEGRNEILPRAGLASIEDLLRTIWIV